MKPKKDFYEIIEADILKTGAALKFSHGNTLKELLEEVIYSPSTAFHHFALFSDILGSQDSYTFTYSSFKNVVRLNVMDILDSDRGYFCGARTINQAYETLGLDHDTISFAETFQELSPPSQRKWLFILYVDYIATFRHKILTNLKSEELTPEEEDFLPVPPIKFVLPDSGAKTQTKHPIKFIEPKN